MQAASFALDTAGALPGEAALYFRRNGFMILRGLVDQQEVEGLTRGAEALVARALQGETDPDFYTSSADRGHPIPYRIEYVVEKAPSMRDLLAHPGLLRAVETLQGADFVPTWDSLVYKLPGGGRRP